MTCLRSAVGPSRSTGYTPDDPAETQRSAREPRTRRNPQAVYGNRLRPGPRYRRAQATKRLVAARRRPWPKPVMHSKARGMDVA